MGASFEISFNKVIKAEGKYQALKNDLGNYVCSDLSWAKGKTGTNIPFTCAIGSKPILIGTKYGISAPTLAAYLKRVPTVYEMQNLTIDTVRKIYQANYWSNLSLSNLNSQELADLIFDGSVNEGSGALKGFMADTVNVGHSSPSSAIVAALNSLPPDKAFASIKDKRHNAYVKMGGQYLSAWLTRLEKFNYIEEAKKHAPMIALFIFMSAVGLLLAYRFLYLGKSSVI